MEPDSLPTEVILTHPRQNLGKVQLDWIPQPGNYVELKGKTYAVLERHHHYQYKVGGYSLQKFLSTFNRLKILAKKVSLMDAG